MSTLTKPILDNFLATKGYYIILPEEAYDGGKVFLFKGKPGFREERSHHTTVSITKHPNCCGHKLIHSAQASTFQEYKYLIGGALLWCKLYNNACATYVTGSHQVSIIKALEELGFKKVHETHNPKSNRLMATWIINPSEL